MNPNGNADVSAIIPCYRCAKTVERALRSVAHQTMAPAEIILVDDASDDNGATLLCLRQLCHTFGEIYGIPIRLIALQENGGPSGARNAAWDVATAKFIAFLDADDAWHPKKIEIQYTWMVAHPAATLSGHNYDQLDSAQLPPSKKISRWSVKTCDFHPMLFRNPLATRTVMMRNVSLRFAVDKRYAEDYLLWLQTAASGLQVFVLDVVLAYSFKPAYGVGGLSGDLWHMERGVQDNFRRLYKDRSIGSVVYLTARLFSFLKYLRRIIIVFFSSIFSVASQ